MLPLGGRGILLGHIAMAYHIVSIALDSHQQGRTTYRPLPVRILPHLLVYPQAIRNQGLGAVQVYVRTGRVHPYWRVALREAQLHSKVRARLLVPCLEDEQLSVRKPGGEHSLVLPKGELPHQGRFIQASDHLIEACSVVRCYRRGKGDSSVVDVSR
jgi:hypothetical protein